MLGGRPFPEVPRTFPSHLISQNLQRWLHRGAAREAGKVSIFSVCKRKCSKNKGVGEATSKVFQKIPEGVVIGADKYWGMMEGRQNQRKSL